MPAKTREERLRDVELQLEKHRVRGGSGGGKPYATVVVSAYNSIAPGSAKCDFRCDGENDEVKIQEAINWVWNYGGQDPDTYNGDNTYVGRIVLLEGNYSILAPIVLQGGVEIVGMGIGKTELGCYTPNSAVFTGANVWGVRFADFSIGTGSTPANATQFINFTGDCSNIVLDRITNTDGYGNAVYIENSFNCSISGCSFFRDYSDADDADANAIVIGKGEFLNITNNLFQYFRRGIAVWVKEPQKTVISGNKINGCLYGIRVGYD